MATPIIKPKVQLVITDLDNTLYDWFAMWYAAFRAMLDEIVRLSGIPEESLLPEIKKVHEKHGTAEYAFLLDELPSLRRKHPNGDLTLLYRDAIEAYRQARRRTLVLYPGVKEALTAIASSGTMVVGYTESLWYYTRRRLKKLELDTLLEAIYSPPDHGLPRSREEIRTLPPAEYELTKTEHRLLREGEFKPNPKVLLDIIAQCGGERTNTIYIGDDLVKDVGMANDAGITGVWAEYGSHKDQRYELLRRVTHWTADAVERQRSATITQHVPNVTIHRFDELLAHFTFTAHPSSERARDIADSKSSGFGAM